MSDEKLRSLFDRVRESAVQALCDRPRDLLTPQVWGQKEIATYGKECIRIGADEHPEPIAFFGVARLMFAAHRVQRYVFLASAEVTNVVTGEVSEGIMLIACDREGRGLMHRAKVDRDESGAFLRVHAGDFVPPTGRPEADLLPQHPPNAREAKTAREILEFSLPGAPQEGPHATAGKPRESSDGETIN